MSDSRLMDVEPGGESTQYESIVEFTKPPPKQTGQLGEGASHNKSHTVAGVGDPITKDDEYTLAQKLGRGACEPSKEDLDLDAAADAAAVRARRQQGYGPDPNVGT
ncbi:hypothetical protein N7495_000094 [Penicillium taxi]|uniref:uncharacterized protein n=1 Tax=Penicillium taxi TaxID=168475 RepID=UPI00254527D1|nr:uncharacterized protein N7495_000094 [Penicillium taxi]KAJ5907412.1 hypothetical protein N7495_000094 [Penicillium taxi]